MNPFELYVHELAANLTSGRRTAIAAEILDSLYAELDEKKRAGRGGDEIECMRKIVAEKELPEQLALSLDNSARSLIGAKTFPIYGFALKISLLASISSVTSLSLAGNALSFRLLLELGQRAVISTVIVFSIVTIFFHVLERRGYFRAARNVGLPRLILHSSSSRISRAARVLGLLGCLLVADFWPKYLALPLLIADPGLRIQFIQIVSAQFFDLPRILLNLYAFLRIFELIKTLNAARPISCRLLIILKGTQVALGTAIVASGTVFSNHLGDASEMAFRAASGTQPLDAYLPLINDLCLAGLWAALLIRLLTVLAMVRGEYRAMFIHT